MQKVIQHIKNAQGLIAKKRDPESQAAQGELIKALQEFNPKPAEQPKKKKNRLFDKSEDPKEETEKE